MKRQSLPRLGQRSSIRARSHPPCSEEFPSTSTTHETRPVAVRE